MYLMDVKPLQFLSILELKLVSGNVVFKSPVYMALLVLGNFFAIWYYKTPQAYLVCLLPQTWDQSFSNKSWFLLEEHDISRPHLGPKDIHRFWIGYYF